MGLALFKERRLQDRRQLTGLLPGKLQIKGQQTAITCRPVDVSEHGIGIVVTAETRVMQPGTLLELITGDRVIDLQVAWQKRDFGKQDSVRYGIVTLSEQDQLDRLFSECGCLK